MKPGIFLGNPTQRVRDELWKMVTHGSHGGHVLQLWSAPNPRGFDYREYGPCDRQLADFEGLALMTRIKKERRKRAVTVQT